MREFQFTLRLRDGRIVTAGAVAKQWQWSLAFAKACTRVEKELGLGAWSGIVCVAYDSELVSAVTHLTPQHAKVVLRPAA